MKSFSSLLFVALLLVVGCKKDDDTTTPTTDQVVASFQFAVSANNFLEVSFSNFSQNAVSYSWNFGDGNTSTDESPTHTYAAAGTYTVTLTATGSDGKTSERSESLSLTDPNAALTMLAGTSSKTWYLMREGVALGIGPAANNNAWWSFGGNTPLGDRPCILDDSYTFHTDGRFEFNSNGTIFVDAADCCGGWHPSEGCWDESDANVWGDNPDRSAFGNGGDYTYDFDAVNQTLTLNGDGVFIGLPNKTADGDNPNPLSMKTYSVFNFASGSVADSLQVAILGNDGSFAWNFYLVSYHNPADLPAIPSTMPNAGFDFFKSGSTVDFTNTSQNATSYMWDFGDGATSSDENPTHTYSADGDYVVTLTAMDDMGQSDQATKTISISSAVFTAGALSNDAGKVWKLDGEASYYVGPAPGSGEWWGGINANDVLTRACQMDDEFIFFNDGTFQYDSKGQVWAEDYMGGSFACVDDGDLASPFDVFASGTHTFSATDTQITVTGEGAFFGWNKPFNGGELPNDGTGTPASEITYEVLEYSNNGGVERLTITIDFIGGGGGYWTMRLISQ